MTETQGVEPARVVIIGVDPGDSTGVAVLQAITKIAVFQGKPDDAIDFIHRHVALAREAGVEKIKIAGERYNQLGAPGTRTPQTTAQQVIGRLDEVARQHAVPLILQAPADARGIASDQFLRATRLWTLPNEVDARDADDTNMAMRHAVLLLATKHATLFDVLHRYSQGGD